MSNSNRSTASQEGMADMGIARDYDPDTGEVNEAAEPENVEKMFETGTGRMADGSIGLPKMTMATIRAMPERCKLAERRIKVALVVGLGMSELLMPPMGREAELSALPPEHPERMTFTALVAGGSGPWGATRYDDQNEPEAVFKSDLLFLPIGHRSALATLRKRGSVAIALEFWSQPARNQAGYSWSYINLAQLDRDNLSAVDRLLMLGVQAGRNLEIAGNRAGILEDLRYRA